MASRAKQQQCRVCGGSLQGNQRRWLFGGPNRKSTAAGGPPGTPTGSRSSQSSPWGSTLSLSSSGSLSRSQRSLASSRSSVDLLAVLTHILGRSVLRGGGRPEFLCGKCVSVLERVFRYDTVLTRIRVLSSERLQRLTQERDRVRDWVRRSYGDGDGDRDDGEAYRDLLRDNMALSRYECWSDHWDSCPYFVRTGKRCRRGMGCEGCDALRVPDSAYEAVCGIPRHLPSRSPSPLSRDKSRSMPLHWQGDWDPASPPSSSAQSPSVQSPSLRSPSIQSLQSLSLRTASLQSLDSLDGLDPVDSLGILLKGLRSIERNRLQSPSGSRIPVLDRTGVRGLASPTVSCILDFVEPEVDRLDGKDRDDLVDDFVPLNKQRPGRFHDAVRQVRGQLDQARNRIRTLEDQLDLGRTQGSEEPGTDGGGARREPEEDGGAVLQSLCSSLHSRERLIQECLTLIRTLSTARGLSPDLSDALKQSLKDLLSENEEALRTVNSETLQQQKTLQTEVEALRTAGRERDRDLDTLNTVLRCNQDVINDLREALQEKERQLEEVQQEVELWRSGAGALTAMLQERASGGGASTATLSQEVKRLSDSLQNYRDLVQRQQREAAAAVRLQEELQEQRRAVREESRGRREAQRRQEEQQREEERLREALRSRDCLIQEILKDAERRDFLFTELQQNKVEPLKHTL